MGTEARERGPQAPRALGQTEGPSLPRRVLSPAPRRPWCSSVLARTQHALLVKAQVPGLPRPTRGWDVTLWTVDHQPPLSMGFSR